MLGVRVRGGDDYQTETFSHGTISLSDKAHIDTMYGHQSQTLSTHHVSLDTSLRKAFRLNRDQCPSALASTEYRLAHGKFEHQLLRHKIASVRALGRMKGTVHNIGEMIPLS